MPHRYRETSLQCSRTTSTKLLHATLAGLGPWARSHNHDVSTATVILATGANRREPAEALDAVRQVHGEALGLLVVVVVAPQDRELLAPKGIARDIRPPGTCLITRMHAPQYGFPAFGAFVVTSIWLGLTASQYMHS